FPGQLAGEQRSYRRLIVSLSRLGIPARASRLAAWHQLVRQAPPAVLADTLGVSPETATRHALLAGADWAAHASRRSSLATPEYDGLPICGISPVKRSRVDQFRELADAGNARLGAGPKQGEEIRSQCGCPKLRGWLWRGLRPLRPGHLAV